MAANSSSHKAAKPQAIAVKIKDRIKPGPAPGLVGSPAAAVPIVANMPAPMIAPMPSAVTSTGPRAFFKRWAGSSASAVRLSNPFLRKRSLTIKKLIRSAAETVFQGEVFRLEIGKRPAQLCQFRFRSVDFEPDNIDELLHFAQKCAYVVQMRKRGIAVFVSFAAKRHLSIKGETIVKASGFCPRLFHKPFAQRLELLHLAGPDFEIWNDSDCYVLGRHDSPPDVSFLTLIETTLSVKQIDYFTIHTRTMNG